MLEVVITFLILSLVFYVLFGGADFGGGIIELLFGKKLGEKGKNTIDNAIAPVWEANHMWLIIVVVILFMGFPAVYTGISTYLHLPITAVLVGIVVRGTAFTFRHYDAIKDRSQVYYDFLFKWSSLWTAFFFGVVTGAMVLGRINPEAQTFPDLFIFPWLNLFCISIGIFTCCIFAFLASIYLIGESDTNTKSIFIKIGKILNIATVTSGGLVFLAAYINGFDMVNKFITSDFSIIALILATISLPFLWYSLNKDLSVMSRLIAGFQTLTIMIAWFDVNFPVVLNYGNTREFSLMKDTAPEATLTILALALLIGSLFILPFLYYLLRIFKFRKENV